MACEKSVRTLGLWSAILCTVLSLATVFAAPAIRSVGIERWIRGALIANGCLIPFLALQMYYPPLIWGGSLWAITFPVASWLLVVHFGRLRIPAGDGHPGPPA